MSVQAPNRIRITGGDDGSGSEDFWRHVTDQTDGIEGFVMKDVGRAARVAGNTGLRGAFDETFISSAFMPQHVGRPALQQEIVIGPDYNIG